MRPLLLIALLLLPTGGLLAGDWNQWRGSDRNGVAGSSPPLLSALPEEGLKPLWLSESIPSGNSGGWGSPVVAGGKVYLFAHTRTRRSDKELPAKKFPWLPPEKRVGMTDEQYQEYEVKRREEDLQRGKLYNFREVIYCLDAATGKTLWKNDHPSVYTRFLQSGSPAVIDGRLYILGAGLQARCVDARSGEDVWTTRLPGEFLDEYMMSSFALADGLAVCLAGRLVGLDASTGELLWEGDSDKTRGTHSSPVVWRTGGRELLIVNVAGNDTICLEPRTGTELWRVETFANLATPIVYGNRLVTYGRSRKDGLRCFEISLSGAEPAWVYQRAADKGSSPVIVGDHVYVQGERRLACVELATGNETWTTLLDLGSPQYTSLVAADGKVIYAHDGVLWFAANPIEFTPLVQAKLNKDGLLATEATFRRLLGLAELERTPGGQEKSLRLFENEVGRHGPLRCATPALTDGRMYVRLPEGIACYDLRARQLSQR